MKRVLVWLVVIVVVVVVGGGVYVWAGGKLPDKLGAALGRSSGVKAYRTAAVKRGDLVVTISATGTVEPEEVIDVGAQVAGQIYVFGKDTSGKAIDYGSSVDEGMVLAQIDATLYQADVDSARAAKSLAESGVHKAEADLLQMQAKYDQAARDWARAQKLGPSDALAETTYDAYRATNDVTKANVEIGKAAVEQAKRQVEQAQAQLTRAERNLSYCTIKSPVKGVIIDRRVNIGQTVVSSLNTPSLFLLAKDLRRMQVWVAVNEADIGNIHPGQTVTFTVDAFPEETFVGQVGKVRLNASMTQNVVTYTVEVVTDNSSGRLLPYLTANTQFEISRRGDVLQVPNAALHYTPKLAQIAPEFRQGLKEEQQEEQVAATTEKGAEGEAATTSHAGTQAKGKHKNGMERGIVWVQEGEFLKPVPVRTGLTDGITTEIAGRNVKEEMAVVLGERQAEVEDGGETNPFTPQFGKAFRQRASTGTGGGGQGTRSSSGGGGH